MLLSGIYFQYVVSFPANLLAFALSNIRKGEIDTCPSRNPIMNSARPFANTMQPQNFLPKYLSKSAQHPST